MPNGLADLFHALCRKVSKMDTNSHKSVAIDIATYNVLAEAADAECRSVSMQIKWLVRNSNSGSARPVAIPIAPVKKRVKRIGKKSMETIITNPNTRLNKVLLKFDSGLTLCSKDFEDVIGRGNDAAADMYALVKRGDITRIGNTQPYYYQLTSKGAERIKVIKERMAE